MRPRHDALLLLAVCMLATSACNTLGELEVGPCAHLDDGLELPLALGRSGGCLLVPVEDRDGQPVLEGRLELIDLGVVPRSDGIVLEIAALDAGDGHTDVAVLRSLGDALSVTLARYRTDSETPGQVGEVATLPPVGITPDGDDDFNPLDAVAGFHLLELDGRRIVLLTLSERRVLWRDVAAAADTPFAEVVLRDETADSSGLTHADTVLLGASIYATDPGLTLAYVDFAAAVWPGQGQINKVASGRLAFADAETLELILRATWRDPVKPDDSGAALPLAVTDRLDHALDTSPDAGESRLYLLPGVDALAYSVEPDPANPGAEMPCTLATLLAGQCKVRFTNGSAALSGLRYRTDAAPETSRGPGEAALQMEAWQTARADARSWLAESAGLPEVPDEKLAFYHLASAAVDDVAVTVSFPVFFGCGDASGYRACRPDEHDAMLPVLIGAVLTVWSFDDSLALAPREASYLSTTAALDAAPIDLGAVALDDARPLFALLGVANANTRPGLELVLVSDDARPLASLALDSTLPAENSVLSVWSSGSLIFASQDADDVRVYLAQAHPR